MKDIAVIGLGKFGESVARYYAEMGGNVLAIDNNEEKIQEISEVVTYAVKADVTDPDVVRTLGLSNMDVVVVAMTDNMEATIMATIFAKEEGVPLVIVKSRSDLYEKVLNKVGADVVVFPEKEMGNRVARRVAVDNLIELIDLSDDYSIAEVVIPEKWVGKTLVELDIRRKYGINVLAEKKDGKINAKLDPSEPFVKDTTLIVMGETKIIEKKIR